MNRYSYYAITVMAYHMVPSKESVNGLLREKQDKQGDPTLLENFKTDPFWCFASKQSFFIYLNLIAALFHLGLLITTVVSTCSSDAGCSGPVVYTHQTYIQYTRPTVDSGFELIPEYRKNEKNPIYLVALPITFFGLSATAHLVVTYLAWSGVYLEWLFQCQQPVRWIEYGKPLPSPFSTMSLPFTKSSLADSNRR